MVGQTPVPTDLDDNLNIDIQHNDIGRRIVTDVNKEARDTKQTGAQLTPIQIKDKDANSENYDAEGGSNSDMGQDIA